MTTKSMQSTSIVLKFRPGKGGIRELYECDGLDVELESHECQKLCEYVYRSGKISDLETTGKMKFDYDFPIAVFRGMEFSGAVSRKENARVPLISLVCLPVPKDESSRSSAVGPPSGSSIDQFPEGDPHELLMKFDELLWQMREPKALTNWPEAVKAGLTKIHNLMNVSNYPDNPEFCIVDVITRAIAGDPEIREASIYLRDQCRMPAVKTQSVEATRDSRANVNEDPHSENVQRLIRDGRKVMWILAAVAGIGVAGMLWIGDRELGNHAAMIQHLKVDNEQLSELIGNLQTQLKNSESASRNVGSAIRSEFDSMEKKLKTKTGMTWDEMIDIVLRNSDRLGPEKAEESSSADKNIDTASPQAVESASETDQPPIE